MAEAATVERPIPVLLCIDVEPDGRFIDPDDPVPWRGYEHALEFFARFRERAATRSGTPARFTWVYRMDPQIAHTYRSASWVISRYRRETMRLADEGDALGVHPHAYRWSGAEKRWIVDLADQAWLKECFEVSADAFARSVGQPCRIFRGGDRWTSQAAIDLVQRLGAHYDLTPEPGHPSIPNHQGARHPGFMPDFMGVPKVPYRPAADDFRKADPSRADGLVIIPVTTAAVRPRLVRDLHDLARHGGKRTPYWSAILSHDTVLFRRVVSDALDRSKAPLLMLPVRTDALAGWRHRSRVARNLEWLLSHPLASCFRWSTPEGVVRTLGV